MDKYNVGDEVVISNFIGKVVKVELYNGKVYYHVAADGLNTADVEAPYLCPANNGGQHEKAH